MYAYGNRWRFSNIWPRNSRMPGYGRRTVRRARFVPLRRHMPMNMWRPVIKRELTPEASANVQRIELMWSECRMRYGSKSGGPFLFGGFGAADAMYAPVVARLHTYGVDVA